MTLLLIAISLFGLALFFVAYRVGRASGRGVQAAPPTPPVTPGFSTSVHAPLELGRLLFALSGCALLVIGCFVPGSLVERSAFGAGPFYGRVVYVSCAFVAALLASTGRFRSLWMPSAISVVVLFGALLDSFILRRMFSRVPDPRVQAWVGGIGLAWLMLLAGAIVLLFASLPASPSRSSDGFRLPPRH